MLKTPLKFIITIVLTLGLSISFQSLLAAWQAPTDNPPNDNIDTPINSGPDFQKKLGDLQIDGSLNVLGSSGLGVATDLFVSGNSIVAGDLEVNGNIRTIAPTADNHVATKKYIDDSFVSLSEIPDCTGSGALQWDGGNWSCTSLCVSNNYKDCYYGNVYWFDSCGTVESVAEYCVGGDVCTDGSCSPPDNSIIFTGSISRNTGYGSYSYYGDDVNRIYGKRSDSSTKRYITYNIAQSRFEGVMYALASDYWDEGLSCSYEIHSGYHNLISGHSGYGTDSLTWYGLEFCDYGTFWAAGTITFDLASETVTGSMTFDHGVGNLSLVASGNTISGTGDAVGSIIVDFYDEGE